MNLTFTVGIIGTLVGLTAGWAGTYLAIASARGPRERAFMVRGAVLCWMAVAGVVALRFLVPDVWPVVLIMGMVALRFGLRWWGERQVAIRAEEGVGMARTRLLNQDSTGMPLEK